MPFGDVAVTAMLEKDARGLLAILRPDQNPADWVAGDAIYLLCDGSLWERDEEDNTSQASDTVIVTADEPQIRFKRTDVRGSAVGVYTVESFVDDAPEEVVEGQHFGVNESPSGVFAGQGGKIARVEVGGEAPIFSFIPKSNIRIAFVKNPAPGYWRSLDSAGNWIDGLGQVFETGAVLPEHMAVPHYPFAASLTEPPISPSDGMYVRVLSGASGDFATHDHKAAKYSEDAEEWEFFSVPAGATGYDITTGDELVKTVGGWSAATAPVLRKYARHQVSSLGALGSVSSPSYSTAPTNSQGTVLVTGGIEYELQKPGNLVRIEIHPRLSAATDGLFWLLIGAATSASAGHWKIIGGQFGPAIVFHYAPGNTDPFVLNLRGANCTLAGAEIVIQEIEQA